MCRDSDRLDSPARCHPLSRRVASRTIRIGQRYADAVTLLLLSGRPGAGKSEVGKWLAEQHGFRHIETNTEAGWRTLNELLGGVQTPQGLGENVVLEWGFPPDNLPAVRWLRDVAGFDAWWLDGDEPAAHQGFTMSRRHLSPEQQREAENNYQAQVPAIEKAWPQLESFCGHDHIIPTVTSGPTYLSCAEIVSLMLPDDAEG
jgi:hypothetical protein